MKSRSAGRTSLVVLGMVVMSVCSFALFQSNNGAACTSNLKQYALGMLMYCQDYDEMLPPTKFPAQVQNRVYPYVKNRSVFSCPETGKDYLPNPALNYLSQAAIESPAKMMMLRDAKPHTVGDGKQVWYVAYSDGHVSQVDKEPKLGKPAPSPKPLTRRQQIEQQLQVLRMQRSATDQQIRSLERELQRTSRRR